MEVCQEISFSTGEEVTGSKGPCRSTGAGRPGPVPSQPVPTSQGGQGHLLLISLLAFESL